MLGTGTLDEDRDPAPIEFVDDPGEGVGPRGVDEGQPLQPQDDDLHPLHLAELLEEAGSRTEEEGAVQPEHGDVVGEECGGVDGTVVMVGQLLLGGAGTGGDRPEGQDPGHDQADLDGRHQVDGDRHHRGQGEDHRFRGMGPDHRQHPGVVHHLDGRHHEDAAEHRQGDPRDHTARQAG